MPERPPDIVTRLAIDRRAALIYRLSCDLNPPHADPEAASRAGVARPILHGLASYGVAGFALPVIAGPMFIASTPDLVVAECRGGIVGAMPALNARTYSALDADLDQIERELEGCAALYAIKVVRHRSHARLRDDLAIIVRHRAPLVLLALGANAEIVAAIQGYGGRVFNDVASNRHAGKWAGFDVAAVAGGSTGSVSPFAFVQEIRAWLCGPLALAGAIASGQTMLAAETLAADFAYIGSPFLAASEGTRRRRLNI